MKNIELARKFTIEFYEALMDNLKQHSDLADAYMKKLMGSAGLGVKEATELYVEVSAMAGRDFQEEQDGECDANMAKLFIDLMEGV